MTPMEYGLWDGGSGEGLTLGSGSDSASSLLCDLGRVI